MIAVGGGLGHGGLGRHGPCWPTGRGVRPTTRRPRFAADASLHRDEPWRWPTPGCRPAFPSRSTSLVGPPIGARAVRRRAGVARSPPEGGPGRRGRACSSPAWCCPADRGCIPARREKSRQHPPRTSSKRFRWTVAATRAVRTLVLTIFDLQLHLSARAWSVLVIYAQRRARSGAPFGLRPASPRSAAVGGLLGTGPSTAGSPARVRPRQRDARRADHRDPHPTSAWAVTTSPWGRVCRSSFVFGAAPRFIWGHDPRSPCANGAVPTHLQGPESAASTPSASSAGWSSARPSAGHAGHATTAWDRRAVPGSRSPARRSSPGPALGRP